jgi:PAS domain S-box-containing protein
MNWQYTPYVLPLIIAALITAALALVAVRRRHVPGATPFAWLMVTATEWLLAYMLEVAGADLPTILASNNAKYAGIAFLPVAWLVFALQYSGQERWATRRNVALLTVVPLLTQVMIWANPGGLFRYDIRLETSGSFLTMQSTFGTWFWIHTAYSYVLLMLGLFLLLQALVRSTRLYRGQAVSLLIGALVPWAANALYLFVFEQSIPLDPTPFAFTVTGLAFAWGLFRFRLLDVVPAARNAVIESMSDGVLVLNAQSHIVDLNPAAQRIIGRTAAQVVGQPIEQILSGHPELVERYRDVTETQAEIAVETGKTQRYYDMRLSPLYDRQQHLTGRLIVLHDITDRKQAEGTWERWVAQLQVMPEVARAIAATRDLDELLNHLVNLLRDRLGFYHVGVFLVDERGEYAVLRAAASENESQMLQSGYRSRVGEASLVGSVISTGEPRIARADTAYLEHLLLPKTRSEVVLPLKVGQQVIGALDVHSAQEAAFDEVVMAVLQTVTDQLAVAIENARLLQEMQSSVRELEQASRRYTEEAWRTLALTAERPYGYRYQREGVEPMTKLHPEAQQAWQEGRPVITTVQPEAVDGKRNTIGALAVPIIVRDQAIGTLDVRFEDQQVPSDAISLVQELANRLAQTLESARLYQDTQRRAARERIIREITDQMQRATDLESLMRITAEELKRTLGGSRAYVRLGSEAPQPSDGDK